MFTRHSLSARSVGLLVGEAVGRVIAAFPSSAYVLTRTRAVICLLPASAPDGAIHARLESWPALAVGDAVSLRTASAAHWRPPDWPRAARKLLSKRVGQFGAVSLGQPLRLLGRGPGLTPDGDDRLCGWLITRHALGFPVDAGTLLRAAKERTHPISQAHLEAAAKGVGTAPFHAVLCQFLDERIDGPDLAPLDRIGHGSGRAAFAGAMAAVGEILAGPAGWDLEMLVA